MAGPEDPITLLRDQLERTEDAARALGRAAAAARDAGAAKAPPFGWQRPGEDARRAHPDGDLTAALSSLVEAVRVAVPPELAERLALVLREVLLAVRAVIDLVLERMERGRRGPGGPDVEDIPIT